MSTWVGLVYFITWIKINASYLSFELQYLTYIIEILEWSFLRK